MNLSIVQHFQALNVSAMMGIQQASIELLAQHSAESQALVSEVDLITVFHGTSNVCIYCFLYFILLLVYSFCFVLRLHHACTFVICSLCC